MNHFSIASLTATLPVAAFVILGTPLAASSAEHPVQMPLLEPEEACAADIDGDGDLDVVAAVFGGGLVSWWENVDGDGTAWAGAIIDDRLDAAIAVYAADMDADGDVDIVGASFDGDDVYWYENTSGDGSRWTHHTVDEQFGGVFDIRVADVDGDGDADIYGAAQDSDDMSWFENTAGDGSAWSEHYVDWSFDGAHGAAAADLDGDGDLDIAGTSYNDDLVTWWENTAGDGSTWTEHAIDTSFNGANDIDTADMDGDGDQDIYGTAVIGNDVVWWENDSGDGSSWTKHSVDSYFDGAYHVDAADLDGDGDLDLVATGYDGDDVSWWENTDGGGTSWSEHTLEYSWNGARSIQAADLDGDGDEDLLGVALDAAEIQWWENVSGDGSSWNTIGIDRSFEPDDLIITDVDGDGDDDIIGAAENEEAIVWWENVDGDGGAWVSHLIADELYSPDTIHTVDMDTDGDLDLLSSGGDTGHISWWENTAGDATSWTEHEIESWFMEGNSVTSPDLDGDGDVDVLAATTHDDEIRWWENTAGDASAWTAHLIVSNFLGADDARAEDLDGDGDLDVVGVANVGEEVTWFENINGDASAWSDHIIDGSYYGGRTVEIGDLDGDGDMDLVGTAYNTDEVTWWENLLGDGSLWSDQLIDESLPTPYYAAAREMDGDGDMDLLGVGFWDEIKWWENRNGDGSDWHGMVVAAPLDPANLCSADIDGDGDLDVAAASITQEIVVWWEDVSGDGYVWARHVVDGYLADARYVQAADLDLDGDMDLVGGNRGNGSIYWWENTQGDGSEWNEQIIDGAYDYDALMELRITDLDDDGDMDLIAAAGNDNYSICWWENTAGDASAWSRYTIASFVDGANSVFPVDLDGDGDMDAVGASEDNDDMLWWENTAGDASAWTEHLVEGNFGGASGAGAADVDGDGDQDILGAAYYDYDITWWENTAGDASAWTGHVVENDFTGAHEVVGVDMDDDGDQDLLGAAYHAAEIIWWENTDGDGSAWVEHMVDDRLTGAQSIGTGDVDGDGDLDVLGVSYSGDEMAWFANGGGGTSWERNAFINFGRPTCAEAGDLNGDGQTDVLGGSPEDGMISWFDIHTPLAQPDGDGDGYTGADDCDDTDPTVYAGAPELCDGLDNDCDGAVPADETDDDGDGYDECGDSDCDDADAGIYPGAPELCDGLDNDCDGVVPADEIDDDGDGYDECGGSDCDDADAVTYPGATELCDGVDNDCDGIVPADEDDADGDGYRSCEGDCDDADSGSHPGAAELCDGADNDCNGQIDDGVTYDDYWPDADGDGYGDAAAVAVSDCAPVAGHVTNDDDCDDNDGAINPAAPEACDAVDNNCDGSIDEGFDQDGDGYATCANDCDDNDGAIHPAAAEICDAVDNNCDGSIDEGFDLDGDGYTSCSGDCDDGDVAVNPSMLEICNAGTDDDCDPATDENGDMDGDGATICDGDCDDDDASIYPGAEEICNGGIDDDCNPATDEDVDGDGDLETICDGDCDDDDPAVYTAASEVCDGLDNDCDGLLLADEIDDDADGQLVCDGDCDDADPTIGLGFPELCDGLDNDCDNLVDEDVGLDQDGDGYNACQGDCNDGEPTMFPGNPEVCDGLDNDCDLALPADEADGDGDGWMVCDNDCDDGEAAAYPGNPEDCLDGIDNDCDGDVDGNDLDCGSDDDDDTADDDDDDDDTADDDTADDDTADDDTGDDDSGDDDTADDDTVDDDTGDDDTGDDDTADDDTTDDDTTDDDDDDDDDTADDDDTVGEDCSCHQTGSDSAPIPLMWLLLVTILALRRRIGTEG